MTVEASQTEVHVVRRAVPWRPPPRNDWSAIVERTQANELRRASRVGVPRRVSRGAVVSPSMFFPRRDTSLHVAVTRTRSRHRSTPSSLLLTLPLTRCTHVDARSAHVHRAGLRRRAHPRPRVGVNAP
eukprot:6556128-Prymnesium_polylepis.1